MTADLVASLDCSTTGVKCVLWDAQGTAVATGRAPLALSAPAPGQGEQDPRDWWDATVLAVRSAVGGVDAARVRGIAVAHQRESFACLDADGEAIRPAMLWLDLRAATEVEEAGTRRVHEITGKPPNPTPAYYKLLWLRRHEPATLERTRHVVDVHGYLVHRMTGRWCTSVASADPLGLVDLATGAWDAGLLADVGLTPDTLGELAQPGDVVGPLSADAADALGLAAGLPVVAGAGDGQAAGLGADVTAPGRAYLNLGTGLVSGCYSDDYAPRTDYRAMTGPIPRTYSYEVFIGAGTYLINWFVDTFVAEAERGTVDGRSIEERLGDEAAAIPAGAEGLLVVPYWNAALTPYWDQDARGLVFGLRGTHGRGHLYRAVLEGLAFELRLCLEGIDAALAVPVTELVAMGGGARSALWCRILADVLRKPLVLAGHGESTCLGAGMLAAAGTGLHPDIRTAAAAMSAQGARTDPDEPSSAAYDPLFAVYRELYPATRHLFRPLTEAVR